MSTEKETWNCWVIGSEYNDYDHGDPDFVIECEVSAPYDKEILATKAAQCAWNEMDGWEWMRDNVVVLIRRSEHEGPPEPVGVRCATEMIFYARAKGW